MHKRGLESFVSPELNGTPNACVVTTSEGRKGLLLKEIMHYSVPTKYNNRTESDNARVVGRRGGNLGSLRVVCPLRSNTLHYKPVSDDTFLGTATKHA